MKNLIGNVVRFLFAPKRPSGIANARHLQERGEHVDSIIIREATPADVPAIAQLHVETFNETHAPVFKDGPKYEIREHQWKEIFNSPGNWFCLVIQNERGELVGFAKAHPYTHNDLPDFSGELNKIYLLRKYHRLGLGKKLLCQVAERFLNQGVSSMLLFGEAHNPTNRFYETLGAEKLFAANGEFHGGYGWRDLKQLIANCENNGQGK
ncbi:MAG: GNAT family N-acetyltransferase [Chitinophagaceae bacterium]